jgi:hypothetical protein
MNVDHTDNRHDLNEEEKIEEVEEHVQKPGPRRRRHVEPPSATEKL